MRQQIESIMREASRIMMEKAPRHIESKEGHANFVTEADRQTQEVLQERLLALLPGSVVFGEEKDNQPLTDAPTWVVDPIDGTLNYIHGLAHSAVSVALLEGKKTLQGYVLNPFRDEFFAAEAGKGAFLNGDPIRVSATPFERALVFYGSSPYKASLVEAAQLNAQLGEGINTLIADFASQSESSTQSAESLRNLQAGMEGIAGVISSVSGTDVG